MAGVYKVTGAKDATGKSKIVWAPAEGAAKKARRKLAAGASRKDIEAVSIESVDVPTSKAGIIEWLNENHSVE